MKQTSFYFGAAVLPSWVIRENAPKGTEPAAVDTETAGFGKLRLLQVATNPLTAYVVERSEEPDFSGLSERPTVWCNGVFDWHATYPLGYKPQIGTTVDIFLSSQVLWAGVATARHGLAAIAKRYFGITVDKTLQAQDWDKPELDPDDFAYGGLDAKLTRRSLEPTLADLRKHGLLSVAKLEWDASHVFWEIEHYGTYLRKDVLENACDKYKAARAKVAKEFKRKYPNVNIASPMQVFRLFRNEAVVAGKSRRLDDRTLALFDDSDSCVEPDGPGLSYDQRTQSYALRLLGDPYADLVCLWRSLSKYIEKINSLLACAEDCEFPSPWVTVRTKYRQIAYQADRESGLPGKGMGRSSSGPPINWQNIAKLPALLAGMGLPNQREAVCPPPGYDMIDVDLEQAHARIACAQSKDPYLLQVFRSGRDIHSEVAFDLLRQRGTSYKSPSELKKAAKHHEPAAYDARQGAKKGFYGNLNGQGYNRLWQSCWEEDTPIRLEKEEAKAIQDSLRKKCHKLERFKRSLVEEANNNVTLFDGKAYGSLVGPTKRRQFFIKKPVPNKQGTSIHGPQAYIFWWMSTEASVLKAAAVEIYKCRNPIWDLRFQGFFHDELLFICKSEHARDAAKFIQAVVRKWMGAVLRGLIPVDGGEPSETLIVPNWALKA